MAEVTIDVAYDGYIQVTDWTKFDAETFIYVGYGKVSLGCRAYYRFSLATLPAGSTVTQVKLKFRVVIVAGGAAHLLDVHAYNSVGQTDPAVDVGATLYNRCASGNLYYDDGQECRTVGLKEITLVGNVCADVENAKAAVGFFSLGMHEEGDNDDNANIESLEFGDTAHPQLVVTYDPPAGGAVLRRLLVGVGL